MNEIEIVTPLRSKTLKVGEGKDRGILALHGYGEHAEDMAQRLETWVDDKTTLLCPQALHPIYLANGKTGWSWMTREDRDRSIANNLTYLQLCLEELGSGFKERVVVGYSQGAQMAMRVARCLGTDTLVAIGGELPPELREESLDGQHADFRVLLGRGRKDMPYSSQILQRDLELFRAWGCFAQSLDWPGAHRWERDIPDRIHGELWAQT